MTATATATRDALQSELRWCIAQCRTPVLRTLDEFARRELIIPEGKHRTEHFRYGTLPWTRLLIAEIDSRRWLRIAVTGCVQGGKSYLGYVVPCLYHLFEVGETVVLGCPTMDIARTKWNNEILPAILAIPRFRAQLPDVGAGSRGGMPEEIAFRHGPKLKFMSAHGGDEKRSSYTARVLVATEIDKMDQSGQVSRETSPIEQMQSRLLSYDEPERQTYLECTVSIESGAIWIEIKGGTDSRIVCPCPACGEWVTPEREHLVGWRDAASKSAARRAARWNCPACGAEWTDKQRRAINQENKLLHRGQSIDAAGRITGELPDVDTLGFRWNAWNNLFWSTTAIASAEWEAARQPDEDAAEKKMRQFYWTTPWDPPEFEDVPLDAKAIVKRTGDLPQGILPADTRHFQIGVDLGKYQSWFLCLAARSNGLLHIPDYGVIENHTDDYIMELAILMGLREFRDVVDVGWAIDGKTDRRLPERVFIDSGYQPDVAFRFTGESGTGRANRYLATLGRGLSQYRSTKYTAPKRTGNEVRRIGPGWHLSRVPKHRSWQLTLDCDKYKLAFQEAFARKIGEPGAVTLFAGLGNRHNKLSRHVTSERFVKKFKRGKGEVQEWEKHGANHWLDCGAGAMAALSFAGFGPAGSAPAGPATSGEAVPGQPAASWFGARKKRPAR